MSCPRVTVPPFLACNSTISHSLWFLSSSSKSQSLTNAFSFSESSFFRSSASEDEAKAETIRSLRKSFASLFSV